MRKEDQRLMLAGHALQGLLASQTPDKGWDMALLAVVSLKVADAVLHFDEQAELPKLEAPSQVDNHSNIITPEIITL